MAFGVFWFVFFYCISAALLKCEFLAKVESSAKFIHWQHFRQRAYTTPVRFYLEKDVSSGTAVTWGLETVVACTVRNPNIWNTRLWVCVDFFLALCLGNSFSKHPESIARWGSPNEGWLPFSSPCNEVYDKGGRIPGCTFSVLPLIWTRRGEKASKF